MLYHVYDVTHLKLASKFGFKSHMILGYRQYITKGAKKMSIHLSKKKNKNICNKQFESE